MKKTFYHFTVEWLNFFTKDGLDLEGFLFRAKKPTKTAWIHVHAMNDFSLDEKYVDSIKKIALKNNISFFAFNNRGMGHINVFRKIKKKETDFVMIGTSLEKFKECVYDIDGAINRLKKEGFKEFVLSGHSTGCQKIIYYLFKVKNNAVKAIVFLSPVDDITFDVKILGKKFKPAFELAKKLVKTGRGKEIMPLKYSSEYWSAQRFYNLYKKNSIEGDIFNYTKPLKFLKKISQPILSLLSSEEQFLAEPAKEMIEKINSVTVNALSDGIAFKGGDHCFRGKEDILEKLVETWIQKLKKGKAI